MSLATRLLSANPGAQVSSALTGALTTPSAKASFMPTGFFAIASTSLTTTSTTIVFSDIPQTFTHLQIRSSTRMSRADSSDGVDIRFNGAVTGYSTSLMRGDGTNKSSSASGSATSIMVNSDNAAANAQASLVSGFIVDIANYKNTSIFKTIKSYGGRNNNTGTDKGVCFAGGCYQSTSAITSLTLLPTYGATFAANTMVSLYGWR